MATETLKVGELARRTGLTVRTLHHYDALGILRPARRSPSGHRLYGEAEVRRLHHVVALRALGLSLAEIGRNVEQGQETLVDALERRAERLRARIESERALLKRVEWLVRRLSGNDAIGLDELLDHLEALIMFEKYYSPEQLQELERRRVEIGEEGLAEAEAEWRSIFEALARARASGVEPSAPEMVEVGRRALALVQAFTGGSPGIERSLGTMVQVEGPAPAARHGFPADPEVWSYLSSVMDAAREA